MAVTVVCIKNDLAEIDHKLSQIVNKKPYTELSSQNSVLNIL